MSPHLFRLFFILVSGVVFGIEIIMSFWAFQLHMIYRIVDYLLQLSWNITDAKRLSNSPTLLAWDWYLYSPVPLMIGIKKHLLARGAIWLTRWAQSVPLFGIATLGLIAMALILITNPSANPRVQTGLAMVFCFLSLGIIIIGLSLVGLQKWIRWRLKSIPFPKEIMNDEETLSQDDVKS